MRIKLKLFSAVGVIAALLIVGMLLCNNMFHPSNSLVLVKIKQETVKNTGLTIVCDNYNLSRMAYSYGIENGFGKNIYILKKEDKGWEKIHMIPASLSMAATEDTYYIIRPYKQKEININWKEIYGELKPGNYKFVFYKHELDFKID